MASGPDGVHSWCIAGACCLINAVMYGMARLSGVLFVASVPRFDVTREQAAFPYTFASFVRNTSGPLVGYLGHRFGVRPITTLGCFLGAAGIGCCFFAESISTITILWGTVFGLGFGLGNVLLPVSINQYFDKLRATASGISYSGACIGSFVLPPVVEILLNHYGLSGTFLFLSGFVLSCVPAALLLKEPDFTIQKNKNPEDPESEKRSIMAGRKVKMYTVEEAPRRTSTKSAGDVVKSGRYLVVDPSLTYEERVKRLSTQTLLSDYSIRMSTSDPVDFEDIIKNSKGRRTVDPAVFEAEISSATSQLTNESEKDDVFSKESPSDSASTNSERSSGLPCAVRKSSDSVLAKPDIITESRFKEIHCNRAYVIGADEKVEALQKPGDFYGSSSTSFAPSVDPEPVKARSALESFSVLFDPMFVLIVITNAIYCFTFVCMITVIVDFARDVGIGQTNEKYVLMSLSVGDLIGRLGLGFLTDKGIMTRTGFATLCFMCQAVATTVVAWSTGFAMLMGIVAFYGLSEAGLILIFPLLVAEFIEEDKQTVAIPSSNVLAGPLCLAVAPLIGFFRDQVGGYDYIFYGIGIISALCGLAWMLTPLFGRKKASDR